jgi:SAM-dependent methyltransferase
MATMTHGSEAVSPWVARLAHLVPAGASVLDVACGAGRHAAYFAQRGHTVTGVDNSQTAIDSARAQLPESARLLVADIENKPWPFLNDRGVPEQFGAVVVTNYLWRALLPTLIASLSPGGVLMYETFAHGNASVGKPSRPDFLLQPGELLRACSGLRVVAFEDGFVSAPERFVQRIVAVRETPSLPAHEKPENSASIAPTRYAL